MAVFRHVPSLLFFTSKSYSIVTLTFGVIVRLRVCSEDTAVFTETYGVTMGVTRSSKLGRN